MKITFSALILWCFLINFGIANAQHSRYSWPEVKKESKTWTRWWWMGSAVEKKHITRSLITFQKAGIGGVEIEPIYGVKGQEEKFINFLSPKWIDMLVHTVKMADSLKMGVDLTLGTGWPWGGSDLSSVDAAKRLLVRKVQLKKGTLFSKTISPFKTGALILSLIHI